MGYQDHLGPSGSILELLMSLIDYLGAIMGVFWVQVGANWNFLGLSGIMWAKFFAMLANFRAIYVFNRLFGATGVNGGSQ